MRSPLRLLTLAGAVLIAVSATVAAPPAPTADSIVADYVAARGGVAKIRSIQTLRQKGNAITSDGREAVVVRELKRPGKTRFEFTVQGVTGVYVSNGDTGWQVSPFDGDMTAKPLPAEAVAEAVEQADIEGPLVDWKAKGHTLELVGHAVVSGRDTYKLKLTLKSGAVRYDYIDVKTHYELRMDTSRLVRGAELQIETTLSDYKKFSGILFPCKVEIAAAGRPQKLRIVVDSVEVNPPIDDARFEKVKKP
jgi:outer membrane lipoprotein-sorting protein